MYPAKAEYNIYSITHICIYAYTHTFVTGKADLTRVVAFHSCVLPKKGTTALYGAVENA
jgi:hypothetical protein